MNSIYSSPLSVIKNIALSPKKLSNVEELSFKSYSKALILKTTLSELLEASPISFPLKRHMISEFPF